ncbi:SDR family oxidoreductase [bacterium]|nr:SDR family oxidoreductase [bacterium]
MAQKRILITGGSGFLGGVLAQYFRDEHKVAFTYSNRKIEIENCKAYHLNFLRHETVHIPFDLFEPDVVIHCAALANAHSCQHDPTLAREINMDGTARLVELLPDNETLFIHISTDLVLDGEHAPYKEDDPATPVSVYGESKLEAERIVLESGKNAYVVRPALIYGPMPESKKGCFMHWMLHGFQSGEKVNLFTDEYRTPSYAIDIARAIEILMEPSTNASHRLYHIGAPQSLNRVEYAQMLCEAAGCDASLINPCLLEDVDTGYPRARDVSLDSARIQTDLGIKLTPTPQALKEIFA